jgi:hypothetical protein
MSRHFQPSAVSAKNNPFYDYIPIVAAVQYATGSGPYAPAAPTVPSTTSPGTVDPKSYVEVLDDQGTKFSVRSNGHIEALSGPVKGTVFKPSDSAYSKVLSNLATRVPANRVQLEAVLGTAKVAAAISGSSSMMPVFSSAGAVPVATLEEAGVKVPIWKKPWFAPAMIVGVSAIVAGAIVFWPKKN